MSVSDFISLYGPLERLSNKGVRYGTVIDVGCADGHFALNLATRGFAAGAVPLNVEANRLYEDSLKSIQDALGGHYRISAVTDQVGDIELTMTVHPYWASVRPEGDLYWERLNNPNASKVKVPTTTLDTLYRELALKPPFLLKLDIQGAEESVLRGAREVLADTHVVVCEADIDDFHAINARMADAGLALYDMTEQLRLHDGTLGSFYPIYVSKKLDAVLPRAFWDKRDNDEIVRIQVERRARILKNNAAMLERLKNPGLTAVEAPLAPQIQPTAAPIGRNAPCPCGSGRKYKHCCGAHAR